MARYTPEHGSELVEIAPDLFVQLPGRLTIEHSPTENRSVVLELALTSEGVRAVAVTVRSDDGTPVTGTDLRAVTVQNLLRDNIAAFVDIFEGTDEHGRRVVTGGAMIPHPDDAELMRLRGPIPEVLKKVALYYSLARAIGAAPAQRVQQSIGLTPATTGRWIRAARDAGYLDGND